jgi:hypothetical protein
MGKYYVKNKGAIKHLYFLIKIELILLSTNSNTVLVII